MALWMAGMAICKLLRISSYFLGDEQPFLRESTNLQRLKSQIVRFQPKRGLKRGILPLFLSDDPPPALRRRMPFGCSTLAEYAEGGREGGGEATPTPPRPRGIAAIARGLPRVRGDPRVTPWSPRVGGDGLGCWR